MDIATDPKLAARLQAGERIWLNRHWRLVISASGLSALPLLLLLADLTSGMPLHRAPFPLLVLGVLSLFPALLWMLVLTSHLRFRGAFLEVASPLPRHLQLQRIVTARTNGRWRGYYSVYACRLTPGRGKGARWALLWTTPYATNANTLLAELRRRCDLTEVSPISKDYHTTVYQRPGFDPSPLALEWWQK